MSDRIRGALFNTLGDIEGLTLLDAFAGTGAISFEAISRGAASAFMIELDKPAQVAISDNIVNLGVEDRASLVKANCFGWSNRNQDRQFDLVIADPPFDLLLETALQRLVRHVKKGGLFVVSWPGKLNVPPLKGMTPISVKTYGDAQLIFYR